MTRSLRIIAALVFVTAAACHDTNKPPAAESPDAGTLPDVDNDFDDNSVYLWGQLGTFNFSTFRLEGVPGATLCLPSVAGEPCATADDDGNYRLEGLTADTEIVAIASAPGYVSGATQVRTFLADGQSLNVILSDELNLAALIRPLGYDFPLDGKGIISFRFRDFASGGLRDAVITASSGDVVYSGSGNVPDPELTASRRGNGFVFDVTPGPVTITIDAPGFRCNLGDMEAFPGDNPNQVIAIVHPDTVTNLSATCAEELPTD